MSKSLVLGQIAGNQRRDHIHGPHWDRLAEENGLSPRLLRSRVARLAQETLAAVPGVVAEMEASELPGPMYREIARMCSGTAGRCCLIWLRNPRPPLRTWPGSGAHGRPRPSAYLRVEWQRASRASRRGRVQGATGWIRYGDQSRGCQASPFDMVAPLVHKWISARRKPQRFRASRTEARESLSLRQFY